MARDKAKSQDNGPIGAPDWMVTFSDCMTLLLTFFVLLMSFASFHEETLPALGSSFADALSSPGIPMVSQQNSMRESRMINHMEKDYLFH